MGNLNPNKQREVESINNKDLKHWFLHNIEFIPEVWEILNLQNVRSFSVSSVEHRLTLVYGKDKSEFSCQFVPKENYMEPVNLNFNQGGEAEKI